MSASNAAFTLYLGRNIDPRAILMTFFVLLMTVFPIIDMNAQNRSRPSSGSEVIFGHGQEIENPNVNPAILGGLNYRNIGPFRGGRSVAVAGHDDQPYIYYIAPFFLAFRHLLWVFGPN